MVNEDRIEPGAARKPAETRATVIGADLMIKGGLESAGEIQLLGRAWGEVKVDRLLIGESGSVEGSVLASAVEVRGRVRGPIVARHIRLASSARVDGDLACDTLEIEAGAQLEGRVTRNTGRALSGRGSRGGVAEGLIAAVAS